MFGEPELTEGFINRDLWRKFELVEQDQLMQQKDDTIFVELLTKTWRDKIDENTEKASLHAKKCKKFM